MRWATLSWLVILGTSLAWTDLEQAAATRGAQLDTSSALDTVKLAVAATGITIAFTVRGAARVPVVAHLLVAYAAVAALGAYAAHDDSFQQDLFRSVRYAVTVLATYWIVARLGRDRTLKVVVWFSATEGVTAIAARLTGLRGTVDGRLAGFLPNLHPNALAIVVGIGLMCVLVRYLSGAVERSESMVAAPVLLVSVLMTGSRTTLGAILIALAFVVASKPARSRILVYLGVLATSVVMFVDTILRADTFGSLATRGGSASLDSTFTGRTDAWSKAVEIQQTTSERLFGQGLTLKTVVVPRDFVPLRGVDGSWHSAYMEAGIVGLALLLTAFAAALLQAAGSRRQRDVLPVLVMLAVLFIMESQLNDVTFGMVIFTAVACLLSPTFRMSQALSEAVASGHARVLHDARASR